MKIDDNGVIREMTAEEVAALTAPDPEPTEDELIDEEFVESVTE